MTSEEQKPLLIKNKNQTYSTYNEDETGRDEVRVSVLTHRLKNLDIKTDNLNENSGKLSYTWSDINVYANVQKSKRNTFHKLFSKRYNGLDEKKHILKNVCGAAYPGEFLAILGSSGSGKTTLLNALTFQSASGITVTGLRCINGIPVTRSVLTSQSAYVHQDEMFIGCLTVREHLTFQALVRMDKHLTYKQRMCRVEEVITELGLTTCENTQIGIPTRNKSLSGGELKRLSFASEVLTNPALMFCDEPTSGLDSFMASNVVQTRIVSATTEPNLAEHLTDNGAPNDLNQVLRGLAQTGKTVICTIHQPSSELYSMFDRVMFIAEGRVAFLGRLEEAQSFFTELGAPCPKNYNPADYYIQLLAVIPSREESCKQAIEMICDNFDSSEMGVKLTLEASTLAQSEWNYSEVWINGGSQGTPYKAGWCTQFRAVLWRSWLSVMKEPMLVKVRLLQTIMVSLLIGFIYYGQELTDDGVMNINGALFIFLTNMTFQNVFAVIHVFCGELPVFMREHRSGMYRVDVYFLSKTLAEAPLFIMIPMLFTTFAYFLVGFNLDPPSRFVFTAIIIILVANVATSFGYLISCASSSVSMALSVGPPVVIPFLLFGGFFLNTGSVPIYFEWLSYLSWFRYGNEALLINQWQGVENITCIHSNLTCPRNGRVILEALNFSEDHFSMDLIGLGLLILGFRLVAFFALLLRTLKKE